MKCWVVIPAKAPDQAKQRLSGVLDAAERAKLAGAMLHHVVTAAETARHVAQVSLVGPSRHGLPARLPLWKDPGGGLNPALQAALKYLPHDAAGRLIVLPGDLPKLTALDVELLAMVPGATVGIAPDRHGTGTNALSLPLPHASGFAFAFGPDSFALHSAEASRLGLAIEVIHSQGLARDIDEPADLADIVSLIGETG